ncbi:MAG: hypothetical protein ACOC4M_04565 [Promethearchaeia archaeon]
MERSNFHFTPKNRIVFMEGIEKFLLAFGFVCIHPHFIRGIPPHYKIVFVYSEGEKRRKNVCSIFQKRMKKSKN